MILKLIHDKYNQENIGTGESIKNNCAQNSIAGIVTLDCIGGDTPTPPIPPNRFFRITTGVTSVCSEFSSSFTILCYSQIPGEIFF